MKIAIVGSRNVFVEDFSKYVEKGDEIVSGGAKGIDSCVGEYARKNGIKLTEFLPHYEVYGRAAPIIRNKKIVEYADKIFVFWDGSSRGSLSVIKYAQELGKQCEVIFQNKSK